MTVEYHVFSKSTGEFITSTDVKGRVEYPEGGFFITDSHPLLDKLSVDLVRFDPSLCDLVPVCEDLLTIPADELKNICWEPEKNQLTRPEIDYLENLVTERGYVYHRQLSYPAIGDQLDAVYKLAKALQGAIELPPDVLKWIADIDEVKTKFKKD